MTQDTLRKIERPDWAKVNFPLGGEDNLNRWFDNNVEPLNKMLDEAVEVYTSDLNDREETWARRPYGDTHKALLVNIQPILGEE
ncbi:MAG: hypothetical protein GY861_18010 [bacterium]|nr:hypothetical protein [bacterium]